MTAARTKVIKFTIICDNGWNCSYKYLSVDFLH